MSKGIDETGVPSMEELEKCPGFPSRERLMKKPVAVIECVQKIPCDACEVACPHGAIKVNTIASLPELNENMCMGCQVCIPFCPGLAIFVVDYNFSENEALISFPYEFLPLPKNGSMVVATDRLGRVVTKGRAVKVLERKRFDYTVVVSIAVPKKFVHEVRGIAIPKGGQKV